MAAKRYPRTHCVQLHVNRITDAAHHFQHFSIEEKPIVIVPDTPKCLGILFFTCCLTVPDGMWVIYQRCGRDEGGRKPGFICCWPGWYRISHVVTKQVSVHDCNLRAPPCAPHPRSRAFGRQTGSRARSARVRGAPPPPLPPSAAARARLRAPRPALSAYGCSFTRSAHHRPFRTRIPCATARRATTSWWRWTSL
jgi:hypothetical protein